MAIVNESHPQARAEGTTGKPPAIPARRFGLSTVLWGVALLIFLAAHYYGWQVTQIDIGKMITGAPKMGRFIESMVQPDVLTQNQERVQIDASFTGVTEPNPAATAVSVEKSLQPLLFVPDAPADAQFLPIENAPAANMKLTVSPGEVAPGQPLTVSGSGFAPDSQGVLTWKLFGGFPKDLATFKTDSAGAFTTELAAPVDSSQVTGDGSTAGVQLLATVSHAVGAPRFSGPFLEIVDLMIQTVFLALMGTTFAVVLSIPLSFLAARNIMSHSIVGNTIYYGARTLLNFLRSIEVLIIAIIFVVWVGLGPFAGMLALTIHSVASLGKLYSEAVESIDPGPIEAVTATGANRLQVILYSVVPQVIPQLIAFTLYRWDINVRMSTVVGLVGGGGIGYVLKQYIDLLRWPQAWAAIWVIAVVVIGLDLISARVRRAVI